MFAVREPAPFHQKYKDEIKMMAPQQQQKKNQQQIVSLNFKSS